MSVQSRANFRMAALNTGTADRTTSLADCRTAVCIARGIPLEEIDPSSGYDMSDRAYQVARDSWVPLAAKGSYRRREYERALAYWTEHRPELVADWPTWGTTS